jgi:hypothetical protein
MILFLISISILNLISFIYIYDKFVNVKKDVLEDVKKSNLLLPKVKYEQPTIEDVDTEHSLLKDFIETAKIEQWSSNIKYDPSYYNKMYDIEIHNHSKSIKFHSRLRADDDDGVKLLSFRIINTYNSISYNKESHENIIIPFLWEYVIKHHEDIYNEKYVYIEHLKKMFEKELITLNRDRKLNMII